MDREASFLESILFLESEPVEIKKLMKISGFSQELIEAALAVLRERYNTPQSGIDLAEIRGGYALIPKQENWDLLKEHYGKKNDEKLTKTVLETLAIIAYSQPITKGEVEAIRGVSCGNTFKLLLDRSLIREVGKKDAPGRPSQYGTTKEFLQVFRIQSISDLPKLNEEDQERFGLDAN